MSNNKYPDPESAGLTTDADRQAYEEYRNRPIDHEDGFQQSTCALHHAYFAGVVQGRKSGREAQTDKQMWWAGYREGKGLPAYTPRQLALSSEPVLSEQLGHVLMACWNLLPTNYLFTLRIRSGMLLCHELLNRISPALGMSNADTELLKQQRMIEYTKEPTREPARDKVPAAAPVTPEMRAFVKEYIASGTATCPIEATLEYLRQQELLVHGPAFKFYDVGTMGELLDAQTKHVGQLIERLVPNLPTGGIPRVPRA